MPGGWVGMAFIRIGEASRLKPLLQFHVKRRSGYRRHRQRAIAQLQQRTPGDTEREQR